MQLRPELGLISVEVVQRALGTCLYTYEKHWDSKEHGIVTVGSYISVWFAFLNMN